jgi:ABC-type glycerol-3-phosphate transport system substrate-binding protein
MKDRHIISRRIGIAWIWVIALVLAACQTPTSGPGGEVTLRWWSLFNKGEPSQIVDEKIIADFQRAYPNIKVDVLWGGREVLTKVRAALTAGDPPDLVDMDADDVFATIIATGQAEPLDDVIGAKVWNEEKTIGDVVPRPYLETFRRDGRSYLLPTLVFTSGFHYDATMFSKLGVAAPTTWDEFLNVVRTLKGKGIAPLASDNANVLNAYYYYWLAVRHAGPGGLLKAAGDKTGSGWDSPALLKAAQDLETLVKLQPFQSGHTGSKWPAAQQGWAQGQTAMIMNGSWLPGEVQKAVGPDFKFRMFAFPQVPGGRTSAEIFAVGFSIPKGAKNVDAAKKFMSFFMNKQNMTGFVTDGKVQTARSDMDAPAAVADAKAVLEKASALNSVYDGIRSTYPGYYQEVFLPLQDELFYGRVSATEFIRQAKEKSATYWKTHDK